MVEIRVLRYFLAVAQQQNISKAAESLHIAQPSLSRQMKDLEAELGVQLLIRGNRQISLTPAGYYLLDKAQEMVNLMDKTTDNLQTTEVISGKLYLGAGESLAISRIMKVVDRMMTAHKKITANFYSGYADDIEARLDSGVLDFGVIMGDRRLEHFNTIVLPERNEFGVIMPESSPLAEKQILTPRDLIGHPMILSSQSAVQDKFQKWWGDLYLQVNVIATGNLAFNGSLLVRQGHALQMTYRDLINTKHTGLTFRPITPTVTDPNVLIWKKNSQLSPVAKLFLDSVLASINQPDFMT